MIVAGLRLVSSFSFKKTIIIKLRLARKPIVFFYIYKITNKYEKRRVKNTKKLFFLGKNYKEVHSSFVNEKKKCHSRLQAPDYYIRLVN